MGIRPFTFIPSNVVEWGRFLRDAFVTTDPGTVTDESFAPRSGLSVIGRSANTSGQPADINASSNGQFMGRRGDAVGFFGINDSDLPATIARDSEVTAAIVAHEAALDPHPQYSTSAEVTTALTSQTTLWLDGQKYQHFCLVFVNTAGTIQHQIVDNQLDGTASAYADKVTGASASLANTPTTLGAGVDFTNGVGLLNAANQAVVLNTAVQSTAKGNVHCSVAYYDGNAQRVRVFAGIVSRDVNGTTRARVELRVVDDMTGVAAPVNTTLLPAGKILAIQIQGFFA